MSVFMTSSLRLPARGYFFKSLLFILLVSGLLGTAGCGSSSRSDNPEVQNPTEDSTTDDLVTDGPVEEPAATDIALRIIQGNVSDPAQVALADANVLIALLDDQQQALLEMSVYTDESGDYLAQIPSGLSGNLTRLIVSVSKDGFSGTDYEVDADATASMLTVNGVLAQAYTTSIKREDLETLAFASDGVPILRLALFGDSNGNKRLATGDVMPSDGEEEEFALEMPVADIDEDAEVINVSISTFDSTDETDLDSYSGDFEAIGEETDAEGVDLTTEATSTTTTDLLSTAFFNVDLTDQNGDPLQSSEVTASDGVGSTMYYSFNYSYHAATLYTDSSLTQEGVQFPFYARRSTYYPWQFVGNGTLVYRSGSQYRVAGADQGIAIDGAGNITFDYNKLRNYRIYFQVKVVNWSYWMRHLNVDRIIANLPTPARYCFAGDIFYAGGSAYTGSLRFKSPDNSYFYAYARNGSYRIYRNVANVKSPESLTGWNYLRAYNYKARRSEYLSPEDIGLADGTTSLSYSNSLSGTVECNQLADITLYNPYSCQVEGTLTGPDGETPMAGEAVIVQQQNTGRRYTAITNSNGEYQVEVACGSSYTVNALGQQETLTHITADQSPFVLDLSVDNSPPVLVLFAATGTQEVGDTLSVKIVVSDPDDDAVALAISQCSMTTDTGNQSTCAASLGNKLVTLTPTEAGEYAVAVTASDEYFSVVQQVKFKVIMPEQQYAPEVFGFDVNGSFVENGGFISLVEGQTITASVSARDRNGDAISYAWSYGSSSCTQSACDIELTEEGSQLVDVTLTDDSDTVLSTDASFSIDVTADQAPEVTNFYASSSTGYYPAQNGVNRGYVIYRAWFADDLTAGSNLAVSWDLKLDGNSVSLASAYQYRTSNHNGAYSYLYLRPGQLATGDYTLDVSVTDQTVSGANGQTTVHTDNFAIVEDVPPVVSVWSSPSLLYASNTAAFSDVIVTMYANDDNGVPEMDLVLPDGMTSTEVSINSANYKRIRIDRSELLPGSYEIQAVATDTEGQVTTVTRVIEVILDAAPEINSLAASPTTLIDNGEGASASAVTVTYSASDDRGAAYLQSWSVSPVAQYSRSGSSITFAAGALGVGQYTVTATVRDNVGQQTSKSVQVDVVERDGNVEIIIE